jgi:type IX secretion system PorP/SprF family membrane protein
MKTTILSFALLLLLVRIAGAQYTHFTQYAASPLTLNPANTGLTPGDYRAVVNCQQYESAYTSSFTTTSVSFDMPILRSKLRKGDAIGVGLMSVTDRMRSINFANDVAGLSVAYHRAFGRERQHHLSFGSQIAMWQNRYQFRPLYSRPNFDFNIGLSYSGKISKTISLLSGYALYSVTAWGARNYIRVTPTQKLHASGIYDAGKSVLVYAGGLFQYAGGYNEMQLGAGMGFRLNRGVDTNRQKTWTIYTGGWYRYNDCISPYIGVERSRVRLGISYDYHNYTGEAIPRSRSYEVSLIYIGKGKQKPAQPASWICPQAF